MTLPVPNLDDRRFQDLVDDAKRMVMRRCPEWTDHNVSDPGVTLIETFAFMTDQLLYRMNRVPDRLYVKFLELIGVRLFPPTPARAPVTFWLSAPQPDVFVIPTATTIGTPRTEIEDPITFATTDELKIIPCAFSLVMVLNSGESELRNLTHSIERGTGFPAFSVVPVVGDTLLIALSEAIPSNAVVLTFAANIDGVGVDPTHPPIVWEAWNGEDWVLCDLERDDTGGLNRDGEIVLHVPADQQVAVFAEQRGGWIRARVVEPDEGYPPYSSSPIVRSIAAFTIGGTVDGINAEIIENEVIGSSEGVPGQRFTVQRFPILSGVGAPEVESTSDEGWQQWEEVSDFASSSPEDRHFILDAVNGEVALGPAVREADGGMRQYGWVPPNGTELRLRSYAIGGGRRGNVGSGAISVLRSSIPFVRTVENRVSAQGGVDGEDIEQAKARGPIVLRTRSRAVTAEDFELLAREAAPEVARVKCLAAGDGVDAGSVKLLVVPAAPEAEARLKFEELVPQLETLEKIKAGLEQTRLIGTRVLIEPPLYRGITVVARVRARGRVKVSRVQAEAVEALYAYLNPISGGPDGDGWPFGRPVQSGELFAVLQKIRGVEFVEDVRIFGADPITGERGQPAQRLDVEPSSLIFSYEHQVMVEEA
jgi:predicted phage baseplate assembly protein